jgi:predicted O-linked N-acetylglucosamine transferase (SPINDLY family)
VTDGHASTTGIPNIDYFISCDWVEPPEGQSHYSERLVRLADLPHYFDQPQQPDESAGRRGIAVPADARWYVCQQTLFKIHPEFDFLLGEILRRDPSGIVVLFDGQVPSWKGLLLERMHKEIPDVVDRIIFLPRLPLDEYFRVLTQADAVLDTIHYGGGTTAMQAVGLGIPPVCLLGEFNRGRVAASLFRKIGLADWVATSKADYVERALRIANDSSLRQSLRARILERCSILYSTPRPAAEMEAFFVDAVRRQDVNRR